MFVGGGMKLENQEGTFMDIELPVSGKTIH